MWRPIASSRSSRKQNSSRPIWPTCDIASSSRVTPSRFANMQRKATTAQRLNGLLKNSNKRGGGRTERARFDWSKVSRCKRAMERTSTTLYLARNIRRMLTEQHDWRPHSATPTIRRRFGDKVASKHYRGVVNERDGKSTLKIFNRPQDQFRLAIVEFLNRIISLPGMESPRNRRKADDSYRALGVGRSLFLHSHCLQGCFV